MVWIVENGAPLAPWPGWRAYPWTWSSFSYALPLGQEYQTRRIPQESLFDESAAFAGGVVVGQEPILLEQPETYAADEYLSTLALTALDARSLSCSNSYRHG